MCQVFQHFPPPPFLCFGFVLVASVSLVLVWGFLLLLDFVFSILTLVLESSDQRRVRILNTYPSLPLYNRYTQISYTGTEQ